MEYTETNKLIAEWLCYEFVRTGSGTSYHLPMLSISKSWIDESDLQFHIDWNWLMPVVDMIHTHAQINVTITKYGTRIDKVDIFDPKKIAGYGVEGDTMLYNTYRAVLDYIAYYNSIS